MIIAAFNPKGGVGKTTTAVNMASALARSGRPVLLLDLESDMHASISVGIRPAEVVPSIADVLLHQARASDAVRTVPGSPNLHLITGSPRLTGLDLALRNVRQPDRRLADAVRPLAGDFDAVIMDSPAGFSLMALSVLSAAEELIVPIRTDYLSLESLAHFLRWYRERRAGRKGLADVTGILLTMVDYRRQATREIVDIIRRHNRTGVLRTEIPQDPRVPEAPSHGIPLVAYAPSSRASKAYVRLTREVLRRSAQRRSLPPA